MDGFFMLNSPPSPFRISLWQTWRHGGVVVGTVARRSWVQVPGGEGLSVWSLNVVLVSTWFSSGCCSLP